MEINAKRLIEQALEAREMAYVPYSGFAVGAALMTADGKVYKGCNIESASYSPTNCAERTAVFKAVSEGEKNFAAIAVVGGPKETLPTNYAWPCGVCRQVLVEFCDPKTFRVFVGNHEEDFEEFTLEELLPHSFTPRNLEKMI